MTLVPVIVTIRPSVGYKRVGWCWQIKESLGVRWHHVVFPDDVKTWVTNDSNIEEIPPFAQFPEYAGEGVARK